MNNTIAINCNCELGEGLYVSKDVVAWLDISCDEIYIYQNQELRSFALPVKATVIFEQADNTLILGSDVGLGTFDLLLGQYSQLKDYAPVFQPEAYRTNDGCRLSLGGYLIGTMHRVSPHEQAGSIYGIDEEGVIHELDDNIYIPNSFVELDDNSVLITDSLLGTIYRYVIDQSMVVSQKTIWYQAKRGATPDGGCLLPDGEVAIAIWDAGCVRVFDLSGNVKRELSVAAKRPTNCKFDVHRNALWVTSAFEGLDKFDMEKYPQSGNTFCIQTGVG